MKKGHIYTLVFMVVLSAVLVFTLAAAYEAFKPSIAANERLKEERAVLYAFDLDNGLADADVHDTFARLIKEGEQKGQQVYVYEDAGEVKGYAFPFEGAALWGGLSGYLGVNADLSQTTGLVFTKQNETPGLGGRIDEDWYKAQFRNLPLAEGTTLRYGQQADYQLDAISGATQTSAAVLRTVNQLLHDVILAGEVK